MMKNILVIVAHADDEVLGCGGTIAKMIQKGSVVHVAFLADGVSSRDQNHEISLANLSARQECARKASNILGVNSYHFGNFPDNQMDTVPLLEIVNNIENLICKYRPDTIITHHSGDLNIDHQLTHKAVYTACRPQKGHFVKTILHIEVASSTEWQAANITPHFCPNLFVDISRTLEQKLTALEMYKDELRAWPHTRSIQAIQHLAKWRGATIGVDAAEAFILGRAII